MIGMLVRMAMSGPLLMQHEALDLRWALQSVGAPLPRPKRRRRWSARQWPSRSYRRSRAYPERGAKRGGRAP